MQTLLEQLRQAAEHCPTPGEAKLYTAAANEIERLNSVSYDTVFKKVYDNTK